MVFSRPNNTQNSVEHVLDLYASSYAIIPAKELYNPEIINVPNAEDIIKNTHIYLIGLIPKIASVNVLDENGLLSCQLASSPDKKQLSITIPKGQKFIEHEGAVYLIDTETQDDVPYSQIDFFRALSNKEPNFFFNVLYIGQAYGQKGERVAMDRLKSHTKLQEISITEPRDTHEILILLLELCNENRLISHYRPIQMPNDIERIDNGTSFLHELTHRERVSLYEASLIRYFSPKYNTVFINSFPSTNMKTLERCYQKDIYGITAGINFDEPYTLPFRIGSKSVIPNYKHTVMYNLHTKEAKSSFFSQIK